MRLVAYLNEQLVPDLTEDPQPKELKGKEFNLTVLEAKNLMDMDVSFLITY